MRVLIMFAVSCLILAGCVGGSGAAGPADKFGTACMFEVNPPGGYVWDSGDAEVKASGGGATADGVAAMNACIRSKVAAAGANGAATAPSEAAVSGNKVTETSTYATPRPQQVSAKPAPAVQPMAQAPSAAPARRACRNTFSGGDGYACMPI